MYKEKGKKSSEKRLGKTHIKKKTFVTKSLLAVMQLPVRVTWTDA